MSDWYVIGSGATLDYIKPRFFTGKNVIAVNSVGDRLGLYEKNIQLLTFSHYHEHDTFVLCERYPEHEFITTLGDQAFNGEPARRPHNVTFMPHAVTKYDFDPFTQDIPEGGILVGSTSLHGAMHLAVLRGATTVLLVGADCGILDGSANHGDYKSGNLVTSDTLMWLGRWEEHLRLVKKWLGHRYDVDVHSINPFLNPNLEGHDWTRP